MSLRVGLDSTLNLISLTTTCVNVRSEGVKKGLEEMF